MIGEMHELEESMIRKVEKIVDEKINKLKENLIEKKRTIVVEDLESEGADVEVTEKIDSVKSKTEEFEKEIVKDDEMKDLNENVEDFDFENLDYHLDLSFLDREEELMETEQSQYVQTSHEVQEIVQESEEVDNSKAIIVYSSPLEIFQQVSNKYKGKEVVKDKFLWIHFDDSIYEKPALFVKDKTVMMEDEDTILPVWVLDSPKQEVYTYESSKCFINPAEEVGVMKEENVMFLSQIEEETDMDGGSNLIVIEDVDLELMKKKEEVFVELKKRLDEERKLYKEFVLAERKALMIERIARDADFALVFERLKGYTKNEDALWNKTPDEIVNECFEHDCKRVVNVIYERCKENSVDQNQIVEDLASDANTLTVSQMKEFLKRYGFISFQVNKMSVEDMVDNVKEIQLRLLKKIPRDQAEQMFDAGLFDIPKDFENRARFFSTQFPQISTQRIVHWRYDGKKECYLVKRVTGATHALYSSQEVARLTEEDLYELADLRIDDEDDHDEVMMFTRFLKKQKRKNFEDINFAHPQSIRTHTVAYLQAEGMSLREILKDQYLCLKFSDVPRQSTVNLLDKLKKWYLDSRTYEYVFERTGEESIRFYHPSEINMFTYDDLRKFTSMRPMGKTEWNACIIEMLEDIAKGLLSRQPKKDDIFKTADEEAKMKKDTKKRPQRKKKGLGIHIKN